MPRLLNAFSAGVSLLPCLVAFAQINAQEVVSKGELPHSIISLAESVRPQGQLLARTSSDAKFEKVPANFHVFQAANAGENAGTEVLRLNFAGETRLTKIESKNKDFVVETGGTCHEGNSYSKGDSCSLMVRFNPQGPGHRSGSLSISNSVEATAMFVGLTGNGYAPVMSFTPSQITTVPVTVSGTTGLIKNSTNLTVDGGDTLYIPDVGNNAIKELDSSGIIHTVNPVFATPQTLAVDSAGILYSLNVTGSTYYFSDYYPWGTQSAWGTTYAAGACTPSTPCSLSTVGMSMPANISIDPYDNLFFDERTKGAAEMPVSAIGGGSGTFNLWYLSNQFIYTSGKGASMAVDGSDNLYNFYNYSTSVCYIQEEPAYNAEYSPVIKKVAGGSACGFSGDGGQARSAEISSSLGQMTFDVAGNLYFADAGNQRIRRIDATSGIISTIAGTGTAGYSGDGNAATITPISNPTGLAVDSQGQVYFLQSAPTAATTQVVRKIGTLGYWNFGGQLKGTSSVTKVITVANTGNSALTLTSDASFIGGSPTAFPIDPTATNCVLTAGATLAAGHSCTIGIKFTPLAAGGASAYLVLMSNTLAGSNKIYFYGGGTLPSPTMAITSPTSGATGTTGTTVTFAVSVTSTSTTKPTGTVQFKVNGANLGTPVTLSGAGTASTTFSEPTASTYSLSATYSGDTNYAAATVSQNLTISASVKAASTVTLTPRMVSLSACNPPAYAVRVSSASEGIPTGVVQLKSGDSVVASAVLANGATSLSVASLGKGSHTIVASYGGDAQHSPAQSTPVLVNSVAASQLRCRTVEQPGVTINQRADLLR
ncbi:MAG TPA: Ig-like domain repeat protein [Acidobacteriaceae bacterium]|jgi:hypothetical protein|nr:Ig-like domain repeat protein [Acidobacteriaceae bacterium]